MFLAPRCLIQALMMHYDRRVEQRHYRTRLHGRPRRQRQCFERYKAVKTAAARSAARVIRNRCQMVVAYVCCRSFDRPERTKVDRSGRSTACLLGGFKGTCCFHSMIVSVCCSRPRHLWHVHHCCGAAFRLPSLTEDPDRFIDRILEMPGPELEMVGRPSKTSCKRELCHANRNKQKRLRPS